MLQARGCRRVAQLATRTRRRREGKVSILRRMSIGGVLLERMQGRSLGRPSVDVQDQTVGLRHSFIILVGSWPVIIALNILNFSDAMPARLNLQKFYQFPLFSRLWWFYLPIWLFWRGIVHPYLIRSHQISILSRLMLIFKVFLTPLWSSWSQEIHCICSSFFILLIHFQFVYSGHWKFSPLPFTVMWWGLIHDVIRWWRVVYKFYRIPFESCSSLSFVGFTFYTLHFTPDFYTFYSRRPWR